MPPKRTADQPTSGSKRAKTNANANVNTDSTAQAPAPSAASKRWSAVSVSRNLAAAYAEHRDYESYKCLCQARVDGKSPDDDDVDDFYELSGEENDEDDSENNDKDKDGNDADKDTPKPKCDAGETCVCSKPASEHPEHPYTIVDAGQQKFVDAVLNTDVRDPDAFSMYVFNDFSGYGVLEVLQNLAVDFVEAREQDDWKEQWAVCQALPLYWMTGAPMPMTMIDTDSVSSIFRLLGQMFLTMLATFEKKDMLKPDSEVKNLGFMMAMYIWLASELRQSNCLDGDLDDEEQEFDFWLFDYYILAYAKKYNIELKGPSKMPELIEAIEEEDEIDDEEDKIKLPAKAADPYKWSAGYKAYAKEHGRISLIEYKKGMGGDGFDITSWTSAKRKQYAFEKKDPLSKKELDMIKEGGVMQMQ